MDTGWIPEIRLRWRHYDAALKPLGRLVVAHSYSTKRKKEKSVKTDEPRWVPVHPALTERLAEWRRSVGSSSSAARPVPTI